MSGHKSAIKVMGPSTAGSLGRLGSAFIYRSKLRPRVCN